MYDHSHEESVSSTIRGLWRQDEQGRSTGALLENAMSVWDCMRIYPLLKQLFPEDTVQISQRVDTFQKQRPELANLDRDVLEVFISLAGDSGELHAEGLSHYFSVIRLARAIGRFRLNGKGTTSEMIDLGRKELMKSRYAGTDDVHNLIYQLFGKDGEVYADALLTGNEHPVGEELQRALQAVSYLENIQNQNYTQQQT